MPSFLTRKKTHFLLFALIVGATILVFHTIYHAKKTAPYGAWPSPITAQATTEPLRLSDIAATSHTIYWLEGRPWQEGRVALMAWNEQEKEHELLPAEYSVRTRVHEYGGGALIVDNEHVYFVRDQDQQIYSLDHHNVIKKITSRDNARFADGCVNPHDGSLFYVMEEHGPTVINSIVKITDTIITPIAIGNDFYSNPRISPDGKKLAYITWNNPNMPWEGSTLWVTNLESGNHTLIAGGPSESIADPHWSPQGELYYVSDRSNWWNIYREGSSQSVWPAQVECALPQWWFNESLFSFFDHDIICSYVKNGVNGFARINNNGDTQELNLPFTCVKQLLVAGNTIVAIAASSSEPSSIILYNLDDKKLQIIKRSTPLSLDTAFTPFPQVLEFPTSHNRTAYGFYYPPSSAYYKGLKGEKPPLIVRAHGGPIYCAPPCFSLDTLFWTSRGFAVLDVNYGGSTGYGRAYRERLNYQWGVVDIQDCINAALYCVKKGIADPARLTIEGGSAGGLTVLGALAFSDIFKAGADYFGVTDLELLPTAHKFEAQCLEHLIGPYPEARAIYIERSPIHYADRIKSPVIIFQGDEDKIVPPAQSEMMYKSLVERKIPTAYFLYPGEQHGLRKAENIKQSYEAQLYFFCKILNIPLTDAIEPIKITNGPQATSHIGSKVGLLDAQTLTQKAAQLDQNLLQSFTF